MAIIDTGTELKNVIVSVLRDAKFDIPKVAPDGTVTYVPISLITDKKEQKVVKFDNPDKPQFDEEYITGDESCETGLEKIAEAISREVINHIVKNAEVAMKARMDQLEADFNKIISTLVTAFIPAVGANGLVTVAEYNIMAAQVLAMSNIVGGVGRDESVTTLLKNTHEKYPAITGADVQIK